MVKKFNVRVYGILMQNNAVLVSDEYIKGNKITKFPGGGLEYGEGTKDCLIREFKEELDLDVEIVDHLYTTDFFVASAFHTNSQVISIYYTVKAKSKASFKVSLTAHNYDKKEGAQALRWIDIKQLKDSDLTLIIDKRVGEILVKKFG